MKTSEYTVTRYDADNGKVFDWKDLSLHLTENEDGTTTQDHLYAKTLWIGNMDSIDNYVEVDAPVEEE